MNSGFISNFLKFSVYSNSIEDRTYGRTRPYNR
jgi:hypothetical protein